MSLRMVASKRSKKGATSKMSMRKMSTSKSCLMAASMYDEVKREENRGPEVMSELNLAEAQVLVTAWHFASTSYLSRLSRHYTRRVLLAIVLATGTLIDIVLVTLYCTTSRCLCHSESCANPVTKLAIILAIIPAASYSLS